MHIAFNINELGMPGLGATLRSMLLNCAQPHELHLHFLVSRLAQRHRDNIVAHLAQCGGVGGCRFIEFDADREFGDLPGLLGDRTAYGRLLLPDLLADVDEVLYLDADLLVQCDVRTLVSEHPLVGHNFAAVGFELDWAQDKVMLVKHGLTLQTQYFNSGVVAFNLARLRSEGASAAWRAFARANRHELISHDQTVLNAYAKGQYLALPSRFNLGWTAGKAQPGDCTGAIVHFFGSPKPWDPAGRLCHLGYGLWKRYSDPDWERQYLDLSVARLKRLWQIRRSLVRVTRGAWKARQQAIKRTEPA
ncbi:glycosyltransferase family 8 protein [Variovorax sp.]|uniref:glycosyltransferase family 8 protein n=1 Tax=Variovorax sp. TaxID=1871043 RepID=UPI002D5D7AC5|nr:glycosyltransferase [Variovorax sp.]HYP84882.1 glycosyltransferase [Variovorax sp.]